MGKFSNIKKLSKADQEELFIRLAKSLASLKSSTEAANLIKDLLSESETLIIARRLKIADLLNQGLTYAQIKNVIKVGDNTIAKVQLWLDTYGEGFRVVLERTKERQEKTEHGPFSWKQVRRKYPMYYWPQILLDEIVKSANQKEKKRLLNVIEKLKEKTKLSKDLLKLLNA